VLALKRIPAAACCALPQYDDLEWRLVRARPDGSRRGLSLTVLLCLLAQAQTYAWTICWAGEQPQRQVCALVFVSFFTVLCCCTANGSASLPLGVNGMVNAVQVSNALLWTVSKKKLPASMKSGLAEVVADTVGIVSNGGRRCQTRRGRSAC